MTAANIFVLFCLYLIVSPLGKVRLGGVDAKPDYSYPGWFAMLFAAGMGIGLMFFDGHGCDDLPLGSAPLGDLCRGRARSGLLLLKPWSATDHPFGVYPLLG